MARGTSTINNNPPLCPCRVEYARIFLSSEKQKADNEIKSRVRLVCSAGEWSAAAKERSVRTSMENEIGHGMRPGKHQTVLCLCKASSTNIPLSAVTMAESRAAAHHDGTNATAVRGQLESVR